MIKFANENKEETVLTEKEIALLNKNAKCPVVILETKPLFTKKEFKKLFKPTTSISKKEVQKNIEEAKKTRETRNYKIIEEIKKKIEFMKVEPKITNRHIQERNRQNFQEFINSRDIQTIQPFLEELHYITSYGADFQTTIKKLCEKFDIPMKGEPLFEHQENDIEDLIKTIDDTFKTMMKENFTISKIKTSTTGIPPHIAKLLDNYDDLKIIKKLIIKKKKGLRFAFLKERIQNVLTEYFSKPYEERTEIFRKDFIRIA